MRAQLGHAPAPDDRRPQATRQLRLRRRQGPAYERCKARRAAARIAVAAAYESIAEEVTASVTEQVVAKSITKQVAESGTKEVAVTESVAKEAAETIAEEAAETIPKEVAKKAAETEA